MNDEFLATMAREANSVPTSIERVTPMSGVIRHINQRVAAAAELRVGIDRRSETFDTFRAQHAPREADAE